MDVIDWLLDSDPAIRWQVLRDLADADPAAVAAERSRTAREGLGAEILSRQGPDGAWHRADTPAWLPTLFTAQLLRATGADPADPVVDAAVNRLAAGFRWDAEFGARPFFEGEVEPCINGNVVSTGAYFGVDMTPLVDRLLGEQLSDGGWNCEVENGATVSSFGTTINVLEGLLEYERAIGGSAGPRVGEARRRGEEYLLERRLFRRKSTGEVIDPSWLQFSFPTWWHYDVLRGLDYLRSTGAKPDERLAEAIGVVEANRDPDGRWPLQNVHEGKAHFQMDDGEGKPSRWNTLRALRVLDWFAGGG